MKIHELPPRGLKANSYRLPRRGGNLIARIKPEHPEGKIILNSHMDTVFPVGYAAKFPPLLHKYVPNASIKVLFPAPGTPVIPNLIEFPA